MKQVNKSILSGIIIISASFFVAITVQAQQTSSLPGGSFDAASSWLDESIPTATDQLLTISTGSEITKEGKLSWGGKVLVNGVLNVNGDFTVGNGGAEILGELNITSLKDGIGSASIVIKDGATVTAQTVDANISIQVETGGKFIVNGEYTNNLPLVDAAGGNLNISGNYNAPDNNAVLKNYGNALIKGHYYNLSGEGLSVLGQGVLEIEGNLVAKQLISVASDAVLIVQGSVSYQDDLQAGMNISGIMIVAQNFGVKNGNIAASGKIVVGGTFTYFAGGNFLITDQQESGEANLYVLDGTADHYFHSYDSGANQIDKKSGGFNDFVANEQDGELWDLALSVFPDEFKSITTSFNSPKSNKEEASAIRIIAVGSKVMVSTSPDAAQKDVGRIEVYTIEGRKLSEVPAHSSRTLVILPNEKGIYIIRASFGKLFKSERVLISGELF